VRAGVAGVWGGGGGGGGGGQSEIGTKGWGRRGTTATLIFYVYCISIIQRYIISNFTMACIHTTFLYAFQDIYILNCFYPIDG
jgi:hypothetical protein